MRVGYSDPVFRDKAGDLQFTEEMQNPLLFKTTMPGTTFFDALAIDPSVAGGLDMSWAGGGIDKLGGEVVNALGRVQTIRDLVNSQASGLVGHLQELAAIDVVTSLRAVVGQVATTVGFLPETMHTSVRGTYLEPLRSVVIGLEIANRVINSQFFQDAVDGIAWIPIVGWIIKIVAEVLTLVLTIAQRVRDNRVEKMSFELAKRFHLPLISGDADLKAQYNQSITRNVLSFTSEYALWKIFMPPYLIPDGSGKRFETVAAADPDSHKYPVNSHEIQLTQGWYMRGISQGSDDEVAPAGGIGFQPGGTSIMRALEFDPMYAGAEPRNIGDYANTARQVAAYMWQTVQRPGPSMFAVNAEFTREWWDNYLHGMLEYGERCILKGFTISESSIRTTHRWGDCTATEWIYEGNKAGKKREIPGGWGGVQHFSEMLTWLSWNYWGRGPEQEQFPYPVRDTSKDFSSDNFFYENTVYAHALRALRDRQKAVVGGYEAFSVFPGEEFVDLENNGLTIRKESGIFPAFGSSVNGWNNDLIEKWENTITLVLSDKSLWQNVDWRSIPQYTWKGQSPREILKAKQGGSGPGMRLTSEPPPVPGGPSMFPPPNPPAVADENNTGIRLDENTDIPLGRGGPLARARGAWAGMPVASRAMLAGAAAMGAVVGVNELYRQFRRRATRFT